MQNIVQPVDLNASEPVGFPTNTGTLRGNAMLMSHTFSSAICLRSRTTPHTVAVLPVQDTPELPTTRSTLVSLKERKTHITYPLLLIHSRFSRSLYTFLSARQSLSIRARANMKGMQCTQPRIFRHV